MRYYILLNVRNTHYVFLVNLVFYFFLHYQIYFFSFFITSFASIIVFRYVVYHNTRSDNYLCIYYYNTMYFSIKIIFFHIYFYFIYEYIKPSKNTLKNILKFKNKHSKRCQKFTIKHEYPSCCIYL